MNRRPSSSPAAKHVLLAIPTSAWRPAARPGNRRVCEAEGVEAEAVAGLGVAVAAAGLLLLLRVSMWNLTPRGAGVGRVIALGMLAIGSAVACTAVLAS